MAQRHGLLLRLEQQIIETIIRHYASLPTQMARWGINLSSVALLNTAFLVWLERLLLRDANIAADLVFELDVITSYSIHYTKLYECQLGRIGPHGAEQRRAAQPPQHGA